MFLFFLNKTEITDAKYSNHIIGLLMPIPLSDCPPINVKITSNNISDVPKLSVGTLEIIGFDFIIALSLVNAAIIPTNIRINKIVLNCIFIASGKKSTTIINMKEKIVKPENKL